MSWWSGGGREGYWESQVKRPWEEALPCPYCKGQTMAKRRAGTADPFLCSNCGGQIAMCRTGDTKP